MFSKELEEVIDAAIADGVLTDKERAVLHKRAQAEGVDPDELDVVIDGRLAKKKKEEDWLRPAPPMNLVNEKYGNVVKCPNCGSTDVVGKVKCPECGYVFTNIKANSSAERLAEQLASVEKARRGDLVGGVLSVFGGGKATEKATIIQNFPVPNTRDDLLEFLSMLKPKSAKYGKAETTMGAESEKKLSIAYYVKYAECIDKARRHFKNDQEFQPYYDFYEKEEKQWSPGIKVLIGLIIYILAIAVLFIIIFR